MSSKPVEFYWRHGGKQVILTGTFDNWSQSIPMKRDYLDEFRAVVSLDPNAKHFFKFVVDGVWRCSGEFPTELDPHGNVNNFRIPSMEGKNGSDVSLPMKPPVVNNAGQAGNGMRR